MMSGESSVSCPSWILVILIRATKGYIYGNKLKIIDYSNMNTAIENTL